jgi:hypothetical protein
MYKKMLKENCTIVAIRVFEIYIVCSTSKTGMSRLVITTASRAYIHQFQNLEGELYKRNANIYSNQNKFISMATAI